MTPLSQARADAVIIRAAKRALRRGDSPRSVADFIGTYCGLPPNVYQEDFERAMRTVTYVGWGIADTGDSITLTGPATNVPNTIIEDDEWDATWAEPAPKRRRWWGAR